MPEEGLVEEYEEEELAYARLGCPLQDQLLPNERIQPKSAPTPRSRADHRCRPRFTMLELIVLGEAAIFPAGTHVDAAHFTGSSSVAFDRSVDSRNQ